MLFPARLEHECARITEASGWNKPAPAFGFRAVINGEHLWMPYRIYASTSILSTLRASTTEERCMALCLFSRHHDGHVRQRCAEELLLHQALPLYIIPWLLKLAEEYVLQIVELVLTNINRIPESLLTEFIRENPRWLPLMQARSASYWDCYYRHRYPHPEEYPGIQLHGYLRQLAKNSGSDS